VNEHTGCFITGSKDGLVKLWTKDKRILLEFDFFEPPMSTLFRNDMFGFYLGHKNSITDMSNRELLD